MENGNEINLTLTDNQVRGGEDWEPPSEQEMHSFLNAKRKAIEGRILLYEIEPLHFKRVQVTSLECLNVLKV